MRKRIFSSSSSPSLQGKPSRSNSLCTLPSEQADAIDNNYDNSSSNHSGGNNGTRMRPMSAGYSSSSISLQSNGGSRRAWSSSMHDHTLNLNKNLNLNMTMMNMKDMMASGTALKKRSGRNGGSSGSGRSGGIISFVAERITTGDYWGFIPSAQVFEDVEVFVDSIQRQLVIGVSTIDNGRDAQQCEKALNEGNVDSESNVDAEEDHGNKKKKRKPFVQKVAQKLRQKIAGNTMSTRNLKRKKSFFDTYRSDDDDDDDSGSGVDGSSSASHSGDEDEKDARVVDEIFDDGIVEEDIIAARLRAKLRVEIGGGGEMQDSDHGLLTAVGIEQGVDTLQDDDREPSVNGTNPQLPTDGQDAKKRISFAPSSSSDVEPSSKKKRRLVIKWDEITGLDFQYAPCAPVTVVIEVGKVPDECPQELQSVVYFLYCTKEQVGMFLDDQMIARDKRLYQLAMKSLPTWSVIINRYSLPVYYSYRFRVFITTLVNIYIVISLLWGFYDLYKNLPFIGSALRSVFDPLIRLFAPLLNNTVILLVPLVWNQVMSVIRKFWSLFTSLFGDIPIFYILSAIHSTIAQCFSQVLPIIQPILDIVKVIKNLVVTFAMFWGNFFWSVLQLPLAIIKLFGNSLLTMLQQLYFVIWTLLQLPLAVIKVFGSSLATVLQHLYLIVSTLLSIGADFVILVYDVAFGFFYSIYMVFYVLYKIVIYPIQKLRWLFSFGSRVNIKQAQETLQAVQQVSSVTAANADGVRGMLQRLQETLAPFQRVWNGFRRIVDSVIHAYHTKIKYRSKYKQRILITTLLLAIFLATVIVFLLIM